ncbi:MAG: hypothetical protein ACXWEJ_03110 [Actinomycetota bacterium]
MKTSFTVKDDGFYLRSVKEGEDTGTALQLAVPLPHGGPRNGRGSGAPSTVFGLIP